MPVPGQEEKQHSALYWFLHNVSRGVAGFFRRHRVGTSMTFLVLALVLFLTRALWHPLVVHIRQRSFLLVPLLLPVLVWLRLRRQRTFFRKLLTSVACLVVLTAMYWWGNAVHDYVSLYFRYQDLQIVEMNKLPITGHERLQPLNSIYSLVHEKVATEMESPQEPDFVRIDNGYRWTMAIEPAHLLPRFGIVKELISVDDAAPDFSKREQVDFPVGEGMLLGKNSMSAAVKSFGLWHFLNYEPADVKYVKDDHGQWVQVVSLIRWTGILFPRPEFGGVQLIRQEQPTLANEIKLMLFGTGTWISPQEIAYYPFLVGQNNLPFEVSRYIAHSFRFQSGFWGPTPWNHEGDLKIPDLPADVNDQPFTTYFEQVSDRPGMLYHYFALEPYDPNKQGLSVSLLVPADGVGDQIYVYRHFLHKESLTGVSAIAAKVMNTRMQFDWTTHRPVEHRPFIRDIDGQRRFFWITTVVTLKEGTPTQVQPATVAGRNEPVAKEKAEPKWFIAGASPNIVITDAASNVPVWITAGPETWVDQIKAAETIIK